MKSISFQVTNFVENLTWRFRISQQKLIKKKEKILKKIKVIRNIFASKYIFLNKLYNKNKENYIFLPKQLNFNEN